MKDSNSYLRGCVCVCVRVCVCVCVCVYVCVFRSIDAEPGNHIFMYGLDGWVGPLKY